MKLREATPERIRSALGSKFFQPKYWKNTYVIVCHAESWHAQDGVCTVCHKTKDRKDKSRYGYRFATFYNKRKNANREFGGDFCMDCLTAVEKLLGHTFAKDYAP